MISERTMLFSPMELKLSRAFHISGATKGPITYTSVIVEFCDRFERDTKCVIGSLSKQILISTNFCIIISGCSPSRLFCFLFYFLGLY